MTAPIVAENGTTVEVGGIYLTYRDDDDFPYTVAKLIKLGEVSELYSRISTDRQLAGSQELWVKLYHTHVATIPTELPTTVLNGDSTIVPITVDVFLAWGPPLLPIRIGTEEITAEELAIVASIKY